MNKAPHPPSWEYAHNNVILCYRMYYRGSALDPTFPAPKPPKDVHIAGERHQAAPRPSLKLPGKVETTSSSSIVHGPHPSAAGNSAVVPAAVAAGVMGVPSSTPTGTPTVTPSGETAHVGNLANHAMKPPEEDVNDSDLADIVGTSFDDRRVILQEVKDHLNLLKEFEGVISEEELVKRKRELFLALPPAPPVKRTKTEGE